MAFIRKLLGRKKKPLISDKSRLKTSKDILRDIDKELAKRVKDSMCLAYGIVKYGFGVDDCGGLYVLICAESARAKKTVIVDEFTVDVDLTSKSKKELLNYLSEHINSELKRVHLESLYV